MSAIKIPKGWYLLKFGEKIKRGDKCYLQICNEAADFFRTGRIGCYVLDHQFYIRRKRKSRAVLKKVEGV